MKVFRYYFVLTYSRVGIVILTGFLLLMGGGLGAPAICEAFGLTSSSRSSSGISSAKGVVFGAGSPKINKKYIIYSTLEVSLLV